MPSKLILALAAVAAAQTTTLEIYAPMLQGGLHATVISVDGPTTTLGLICPEDSTEDECELPRSELFTHINSPNTMSFHYEEEQNQISMDGHCDLDTVAVCTAVASSGGRELMPMSESQTIEDWTTWMNTVTVTSGAEKLTAAGDSPTKTSNDGSSETGSGESEDEGEGDDDSGAAQLACGSLLGAAVVAVGAVLL